MNDSIAFWDRCAVQQGIIETACMSTALLHMPQEQADHSWGCMNCKTVWPCAYACRAINTYSLIRNADIDPLLNRMFLATQSEPE